MGLMSKKLLRNFWPLLHPHRESNQDKCTRLKRETDARCSSEAIDRQLNLEREQRQKFLSGVKILLVGQSESGKSTVLKNFQFYFAPKAFQLDAERWRPIIQLNLVQSVIFILAFISSQGLQHHHQTMLFTSPKIRTLCLRLAPLRTVEEDFLKILSKRPSPEMQRPLSSLHELEDATLSNCTLDLHSEGSTITCDQSHLDWLEHGPSRRVLDALGEDIAALWLDESLQQALKSAEIALEEQPGFFLDHAVRVTRESYKPRLDDVLKARMTTLGPAAYNIVTEGFNGHGKQWTIYDVGGSRNQRAAWAQFFDDVNVIIFLAPLSGFNQFLAEDKEINRLADSLSLWQVICSNKILASVNFVLFLNKWDILNSKLNSGIQFASFVTPYANRPNETQHVTQYLLDTFTATHKKYSPRHRKLHSYVTCAVDTIATASVIKRIKKIIVVKLLTETEML